MAERRDSKPSEGAAQAGRRALPIARPAQTKLQAPTIMNRALAAEHGIDYVQLAVFAIDLDRAYVQAEEDEEEHASPAPFGWEVFVTECYLLARIDPSVQAQHALLAHACVTLLEQEPDEQGYGSQLLFAVHDATARGFLPADLNALFRAWRTRPKQLHKALNALWSNPAAELASCAAYALALALDPPLAAPTREALEHMRQQTWPLPSANKEPDQDEEPGEAEAEIREDEKSE